MLSRWSMFSLVICSSFSCHLVSNLAKPRLTPKPHNIADLLNMGYSAPSTYRKTPVGYFLDFEDPISTEWVARTKQLGHWGWFLDELRANHKTAIFGQILDGRPYFIPFTPKPIPNDILGLYETMGASCVSFIYEAFAFQRGSPFLAPFNEYVMNLARFGILKKITDDTLNEVAVKNPTVESVMRKPSRLGLKPLSVFHLKGVFVALVFGHSLAIVTFLGEIANSIWFSRSAKLRANTAYWEIEHAAFK